jgi:APA family basic amino acid/polyamine antiporter
MEQVGYFTRKATGLVRQISAFDSFVFNQSYINVGMILLYTFLFAAAFYPAGGLTWAIIIGALIAIPTALTHAMFAATFPRSGGEYVYNSRIISPAWGFASNWNITIWIFFYMGVGANWFPRYGLSPLFRYIGISSGYEGLTVVSNWMATQHGAFIVGTCALVLMAFFYSVKPIFAVRFQRWYFFFGVVGVLIIVIALLLTDRLSFQKIFDGYFLKLTGTSDGYSSSIAKAGEFGFAAAPVAFFASFIILYLPGNFYFWGNASTYAGGEVKQAKKSQLLSLPAAVIFSAVLALIAVAVFSGTMGKEFLGAINYNSLVSPQDSPTLLYSELGAIATNNVFIGAVALAGCSYWSVAFVVSVLGVMTRNLLAWSIDRVMPDKLSKVHDKTHTPVIAIIVGALACELGLFLFTYVPAFAVMVGIFGAYLTYMTTSIAAVIFPFRRKELYNLSPVNWRVVGIPVISVVGLLSLVGLAILDVSVFSDVYSGISISPAADAGAGAGVPFRMFWLSLGIYVSGFIVYWIAKFIRKRQGIDISLAYREIPPE